MIKFIEMQKLILNEYMEILILWMSSLQMSNLRCSEISA